MTKETKDLGAAPPRSLTDSELAVETVLGFAEKWADGKRRDREAFNEAVPLVRALRKTPGEERRRALEEAAAVCKALSASPRGNDYGSVGNAYEECADAIEELPEGTAPKAPPDSSAALLEARRLLHEAREFADPLRPFSAARYEALRRDLDAFLRSDSERSEPARSESGGSNSVDAPTKEER